MDDDNEPRRRDDVLAALTKQSLDPLSVDELDDRIAVLEEEITRTRARIAFATSHKASADALFKKN
jgi:uncharacterized small protein (DUF1192 family)